MKKHYIGDTIMKQVLFKDQHKQYATVMFFLYCCLHYFYFGRLFKNIDKFKWNGINFELPNLVNLECNDMDSISLYLKFNLGQTTYDEVTNLLFDVKYYLLHQKTYTKNDMIEIIKEFAIRHEKDLYWNYEPQ